MASKSRSRCSRSKQAVEVLGKKAGIGVRCIIPYLACLGLSVPFLLLALFSLHQNGVSAIQGGFLQMLTTIIGSDTLRKAAAGNSLGGEENVPEELKRLKIRYGELLGGNTRDYIRRAGFSTTEEVGPLRRGVAHSS